MKGRLDQYKGRLEPTQIADGMNAANENSRRLAAAASLLLESENFPLAASISLLSIEESGKLSILRSLAVARDDKEVLDCWRDYRSHKKKNVMGVFREFVSKDACLDDFAPLFKNDAEHSALLDQLKQLGFYTDCLGKAHWSRPETCIDRRLAKALVDTAHILAKNGKVSPTEIELWIKHVGPVWKGSKEAMESGLVRWYEEMQRRGLAEKGPNDMEEFILGRRRESLPPNESQGEVG